MRASCKQIPRSGVNKYIQQQTQPAPNPPKKQPRVPPEVMDLNVNHCKNPGCQNFNVPVAEKTAYGTNPLRGVVSHALGSPSTSPLKTSLPRPYHLRIRGRSYARRS